MIIDTHTHIFTNLEGKTFTAQDLLFSMDQAGIDYALLLADSTIVGGVITTEQAIQICKENPRLKPIGCVQYAGIDQKHINTLVGYVKEGTIHGVKLYPGYENFYPGDEKLFPLYKACQELEKPVIFHTGILMEGLPGLLKQAHPLNIDEVANKFPELKIVMAHFGNPWVVDAAAVLARNKNVYVDLSGYFAEFQPLDPKAVDAFLQDVAYLKAWAGDCKRFLFATDWPLYSQKEYLQAVQQIPMTPEEKELVFYKNAQEVFNLQV